MGLVLSTTLLLIKRQAQQNIPENETLSICKVWIKGRQSAFFKNEAQSVRNSFPTIEDQ